MSIRYFRNYATLGVVAHVNVKIPVDADLLERAAVAWAIEKMSTTKAKEGEDLHAHLARIIHKMSPSGLEKFVKVKFEEKGSRAFPLDESQEAAIALPIVRDVCRVLFPGAYHVHGSYGEWTDLQRNEQAAELGRWPEDEGAPMPAPLEV